MHPTGLPGAPNLSPHCPLPVSMDLTPQNLTRAGSHRNCPVTGFCHWARARVAGVRISVLGKTGCHQDSVSAAGHTCIFATSSINPSKTQGVLSSFQVILGVLAGEGGSGAVTAGRGLGRAGPGRVGPGGGRGRGSRACGRAGPGREWGLGGQDCDSRAGPGEGRASGKAEPEEGGVERVRPVRRRGLGKGGAWAGRA